VSKKRGRGCTLLGLFALAALLALGFWLVPRGIGLYHQLAGGRLLAQLETSATVDTEVVGKWHTDLGSSDEALALASAAVSHLEVAAAIDPGLSHAYLLLGRSHHLLGEHTLAIQAYRQYTNLRPDNPLGHLELGQALEGACFGANEEPLSVDPSKASATNGVCADERLRKALLAEWKAARLDARDFQESF